MRYTMIDTPAPASRPTIRKITIRHITDESPDLSFLTDSDRYTGCTAEETAEYDRQDRARLRAYNTGQWYMIGIRAEALIAVPMAGNCACLQTISSPGLWGIESDSDQSHFDQTAEEELEQLRTILTALAVDLSSWPANIKTRGA